MVVVSKLKVLLKEGEESSSALRGEWLIGERSDLWGRKDLLKLSARSSSSPFIYINTLCLRKEKTFLLTKG